MQNWKLVCCVTLLLQACSSGVSEQTTLPQSPVPTVSHPYSGFWADEGHCDEGFGLVIAPAAPNMYSVSFCGPGGCFDPGTYRPNTPLVGDSSYQLIDLDTIDVSTNNGSFQRYERCKVASN